MGAFPCLGNILTLLLYYCNIFLPYLRTKDSHMLTIKQRLLLMLALLVFSVSLMGSAVTFELARETQSRATINTVYILDVFGGASGVLIAAYIALRGFCSEPLLPEFPLWMKLCAYYAVCMVAAGTLSFVFTGDTWQQRVAMQELEQTSNYTAINAMMVVIGLANFGCLWLIDRHDAKSDHSLKS